MRGKKIVDFIKAVDLFSRPQGVTRKEFAEHFDIKDLKALYRARNVIEMLGFPVVEMDTDGKEKRWSLAEDYVKKLPNISIPNLNLTLSEIIFLYLVKGESTLYKGTGIEKHIEAAFNKLALFIPEKAAACIDRIKFLSISNSKFSKDYAGKEEIIDQLTEAILTRQTCRIKYHAFYDNKKKQFKIDPLHFFKSNEGLYLLVNTTSFGEIRPLAVERILHIEITGTHFQYPTNLDPTKLLETAFDIVYGKPFHVKIQFSGKVARYIKERIWSKTQTIEELDDGSVILSMQTSGKRDVKIWILSYGPDAMVLEPEELRKEVLSDIRETYLKYRNNTPVDNL